MNAITDFFIKPTQTSHKKYEALRAIYVDGLSAEQVARKFGYSIRTIYSMCRDFSMKVRLMGYLEVAFWVFILEFTAIILWIP
jgi:DNA-binding CsgD family transcriptional regulator